MANGCCTWCNPPAQSGGGSCVCRSPAAGRNRCWPPPRWPWRDVLSAGGACCSSRTRTAGSFHHSTPCAAKGSGSVRYRTSGERIFRRMETPWQSWSKLSSGEPHPDLFVAGRAAEGGRGGERQCSSRSRLGTHRSRLVLVEPGVANVHSELLFIRLDGTSHVLWSQQGGPAVAVPSPDGTHLAIVGWTRQSNVWMLTDF